MLSDSPSRYREQQECADFIKQAPAVWDEPAAVDGKIGEHIVMARHCGENFPNTHRKMDRGFPQGR